MMTSLCDFLCSYVSQGVIEEPLDQIAELVKDIESSYLWEKYLVVS